MTDQFYNEQNVRKNSRTDKKLFSEIKMALFGRKHECHGCLSLLTSIHYVTKKPRKLYFLTLFPNVNTNTIDGILDDFVVYMTRLIVIAAASHMAACRQQNFRPSTWQDFEIVNHVKLVETRVHFEHILQLDVIITEEIS